MPLTAAARDYNDYDRAAVPEEPPRPPNVVCQGQGGANEGQVTRLGRDFVAGRRLPLKVQAGLFVDGTRRKHILRKNNWSETRNNCFLFSLLSFSILQSCCLQIMLLTYAFHQLPTTACSR